MIRRTFIKVNLSLDSRSHYIAISHGLVAGSSGCARRARQHALDSTLRANGVLWVDAWRNHVLVAAAQPLHNIFNNRRFSFAACPFTHFRHDLITAFPGDSLRHLGWIAESVLLGQTCLIFESGDIGIVLHRNPGPFPQIAVQRFNTRRQPRKRRLVAYKCRYHSQRGHSRRNYSSGELVHLGCCDYNVSTARGSL
jgi:hypothetical protein